MSAGLNIIIVGGGIAGLATAASLASPGRTIRVLEQSSLHREIGANISLQPNAMRMARKLGLVSYLTSRTKGRGVSDRAFVIYGTDSSVHARIELERQDFGEDRMCFHRVDLHRALKEAAEDRGVEMITSTRVDSVDCQEGIVTTESGQTFKGDLIIGADGIHSVLRRFVIGEEVQEHFQPKPTGFSAYRLLLNTQDVSQVPGLPSTFRPGANETTMMVGKECRVIMGPSRDGSVTGVVALVPDSHLPVLPTDQQWNRPGDQQAMLRSFNDFPRWIKDILSLSEELGLYQLRDIDALPRWSRGKVVLVGDAAHAMLPTQGQGASQSIEDAEALQHFLTETNAETIPKALQSFFHTRVERTTLIQAYSRQQARQGTDKSGQKVLLNPREFMQYNCDYHGAQAWLLKQPTSAVKSSTVAIKLC